VLLAWLPLMLAVGCADLQGERWEVRALDRLSRGSLSVRATGEGPDLEVLLTLYPSPEEEAHVTDIFLTSVGLPPERLGVRATLPPDDVQAVGGPSGAIGFGFLYSTGDVERYVSRYSRRGYAGTEPPPGPERLEAKWTLVGSWARSSELDLTVEVVMSLFPHKGQRTEQARFILIRPRDQGSKVGGRETSGPVIRRPSRAPSTE